MTIKMPVKAKNDKDNKTEKVICDCSLLWSLAHQFSYLRLSDKTGDNEYLFVDMFLARAKRIAATYARFYLEIEEGGDKDKMGRYYWMGLGAFASKTVGCILDSFQIQAMYRISKVAARGLGQGNLWLFMDIASSHWLYSNHPENFHKGMACGDNRHINKLVEHVKKTTEDLPWADKTISKINGFKPSGDIILGFELIKKFENASSFNKKRKLQLKQVLRIAEHEQAWILEPLVYEDKDFARWAAVQRWPVFKQLSPTIEITFTHACKTKVEALKSEAPDDMVVEHLRSRMNWITDVAKLYHKLMDQKKHYMIQELEAMAGWVKTADNKNVF